MSYRDQVMALLVNTCDQGRIRSLAASLAASDMRQDAAEIATRADARIAELEQAVTVRDTEIARLETDLEFARGRIAELGAKLSAACDIICDLGGEFREPDMDDARRRAQDAARWRYCNANAEWFRNEERTHIAISVKHGADLSCKAFREMAIDAARAGGGETGDAG